MTSGPLAMRASLALCATILANGCNSPLGGDEEAIPPLQPIEPVASIRTLWSTDAGAGTDRQWLTLVPAVADGAVYVADARGRIAAYDAANGVRRWRVEVDASVSGGAGAGAGVVLVGTDEGKVFALDAVSGTVAWRGTVSSEVLSPPQVGDANAVVRTLDGKLFALDTSTGELRWIHDGGSPSLSVRGTSPPLLYAGLAVSGFDNGRLAALRAAGGQIVWETSIAEPRGRSELDRLRDVDSAPVAAGRLVYASAHDREIAAFEVENGRAVWRRAIASHSGLAVDSDLLFLADADGVVHALDRRSGATIWTQRSLSGREPSWPVVHGPYVVFADLDGHLHWLRREDGRVAGRVRADSRGLAGPPSRHEEMLIAYGTSGRLAAFGVE